MTEGLFSLFAGPLEACGDWKKACSLFSQVFSDLFENSSRIRTFRNLALDGLPHAAESVHKEDLAKARTLFTYLRSNSAKGKKPKGFKKHAFDETVKKLTTAGETINAASIIFAHSMLDSALTGLCRAAAYNQPKDWQPSIADRDAKLGDFLDGNTYSLIRRAFENLMLSFDRRSLIEKSNILYKICGPHAKFPENDNYKFSKQKLKTFDDLRHEIVHPTVSQPTVKGVDGWITYAYDTGMHFLGMLHSAQQLYVDEKQMLPFVFVTSKWMKQSNKQIQPNGEAVG